MDPRVSATELRSCSAQGGRSLGASAIPNCLRIRARDKCLRIDYMSLMINLTATYWYFRSSLAAGGLRSI
ncbi:hypothetical protein A4R29_01020 [Mesorhizobium ciceri biovar biserrulae]|nr:hypothetical protein A4R29_01020 [Mesorhizobium ciceri biovar biserrulae]